MRILILFAGLLHTIAYDASCQDYSFREYGVRDGLPQTQASIIYQDRRGFIWISTKNGLSRFDGIDFINYRTQDGLPSNIVSQAYEDSAGDLWVKTNLGLSKYTGDGFIFYPPGEEDSEGKLFPEISEYKAGNPETKLIISGQQQSIEYFTGSGVVAIDLPFKTSGLFTDREGTAWFSSESNIFRLLSPAFEYWTEEVIKLNDPWAICEDRNGNIWLGSLYSDLRMYDGSGFKNRNDYKKACPEGTVFYKGSRLLANGQMWLSTNSGVLIWDGSSFSSLESIPDNCQVCYIYEDPDDNKVLIGTDKGVFIIDKGVTTCLDQFTPFDLGVIEGIVKDDEGFYWMSGHKGLSKLYGTEAVEVVDNTLPGVFTYTLEKDRAGGIWVSSEEGLFFKGRTDNNFSHGIPGPLNKPANTVKILDESHLLVGRITDICIIDLDRFYRNEKDYFRIFDKSDGYPGGECLDNGIIKGKDGAVWILTSENLVRFRHEMLRKNPHPPSVMITGIYYETDSLTWESVRKEDFYYGIPSEIRLNRNENKIRITFTGISTPNPEKVTYQYMLKETEEKWSLPFNTREVVFRNLSPGNYSFLLKGINADGVETPEPLVMNFTIRPALSETMAFGITFSLLVVVITVFLTRFLVKRSQLRKEEKQKLKSELLRLQMHSILKEFDHHFTFNAISSVGSLIMKNDRKAAYLYLTRLSSLLRTSIRESSSMLKPISEELDFVRNYCELQKLRFGERFNYSIFVGEDVDLNKELPKMTIQTFVENAIKHGFENRIDGGMVDIIITHDGDYHKIVLRDNGIGRAESVKIGSGGSGYGIKTVYRVIDIMNRNNHMKASLEIRDPMNDGVSSGTEVVIRIPDNYNFRTDGLFGSMEDFQGGK